MKGKLHKTDEGWIVRYIQEDPRDPLPELPLHPEYQTILPLDLDLDGKEVEFDWCVIVDHDTGKGREYAKLIQPREKISNESWEGCDGCTEQDKYFWTKGYQAGYNRATPTEISDDRTKLHWKTSLIIHTPELSDEEIFKQSVSAMEERYGSGCDEEIDAHFRGAVWYREQLKNKL